MTTSNHFLTGSLIALVIKEPVAVLPLAFLSHFVLDIMPHFGFKDSVLGSTHRAKYHIYFESFGLLGVALLVSTGIYGWNLVTISALLAASPDLQWAIRYVFYDRRGIKPPKSITAKIHKKIQWCERPWGLIVEVLYFVAGFILLQAII